MNSPLSKPVPLTLPAQFKGQVFQVMDALDYGDAVSNVALTLQRLLTGTGVKTRIHSKWFHDKVAEHRSDLSELRPSDDDIVIIHFSGYSEQAWPYLAQLRCTRVMLYHNITPHRFFDESTDIYRHCLKGREQLGELVRRCHFHWADSQYNLDELIGLGADPAGCAVVPIVVEPSTELPDAATLREAGRWLFVGRVAASKGLIALIRTFAAARKENAALAQKLVLVGGYGDRDPYYAQVRAEISKLGLGAQVSLTGKVSDAEVQRQFRQASVYVSMSEHEGFGVPLIEATFHDLPVVALDNSAVGETLGPTGGLADGAAAVTRLVLRVLTEPAARADMLAKQRANAPRFTSEAVGQKLADALRAMLPAPHQFARVSVVICTYNRSELLDRCLDYLQYQTNRNFEVVVVNGPSTDTTDSVIEAHAHHIKVVRNPERNLSRSRNLGIEHAAGDLIAFIDDDALPFDDWVDTLLREFNSRPLTLAGLGGPAYYAGSLEWQVQDIGINRFAESNMKITAAEVGRDGWERSLLGTNTCFRADILRAERGFDEQFDYFLDESELCFRLQLKNHIVGYCPDLYLRHEFAQSHNRSGKHSYNWRTICKNTAYFVAAYSGLEGKKLTQYLERRMDDERIAPLRAAMKAGEISETELNTYVAAIRGGVTQGLLDAREYPRTRALAMNAPEFLPYADATEAPVPAALHVCIVTKEFPPFVGAGGIGTLYYNLASELLLMGHRVTVLTPAEKDSVYQRGRFTLRHVRKRYICEDTLGTPGFVNNLNWSTSAFHAIAALNSDEPIDVIDSALWDAEALVTSLAPKGRRPPIVVRLVTPLPVVARLNGWSVPEYEFSLYCAAERSLIDNADAVVPISRSIASTIEKEHGVVRDSRWVQSYCGIAYWPSFESHLGYAELGQVNGKTLDLPSGARLVVFVGRLEGRKGVGELVLGARSFLAADPQAHLVLAGRDTDNFEALAAKELSEDVLSRVHFVGQVDDATRDKLLHAAHCVVFPSRYESFGLVPLEAFVHSVPVVAARAGAIPEVVADDECGLLFDAGDASDLARKVERLLLEPGLRERLSAGAYRQIRRFSSRKSAQQAVALYRSLTLPPQEPVVPALAAPLAEPA